MGPQYIPNGPHTIPQPQKMPVEGGQFVKFSAGRETSLAKSLSREKKIGVIL